MNPPKVNNIIIAVIDSPMIRFRISNTATNEFLGIKYLKVESF